MCTRVIYGITQIDVYCSITTRTPDESNAILDRLRVFMKENTVPDSGTAAVAEVLNEDDFELICWLAAMDGLQFFWRVFFLMHERIRDTIGYVDSSWQCHRMMCCCSILGQSERTLVGVERIMTFGAKNGSKGLYLLVLGHF